ncbi:MAG: hypothetical protein MK135_04755 [Polyangiaceae bacterium]|nr:hypothetical protein [Polyangiaceae bacterium]
MLYNLANAYERLGDYRKASLALEVYLPHAPAASQPQLQERMERLHQQADRKKAQEDAHQRALEEAALAQEEVATVPVTRAVGYGALVAATASLGVGTGYVISAAARRRATLQDCVEVGTNVYCDTASESGLEQVRNRAITGYSLLAFGALAAGLGTYLIVISTPSQEKLELGVGWGTLDLRGEF